MRSAVFRLALTVAGLLTDTVILTSFMALVG